MTHPQGPIDTTVPKHYIKGDEGRRNSYVYLAAAVAAVGGFLFGYDLCIIAGVIIFLKKQFALGPAAEGFAVSSAFLGCIIGPLAGSALSDRMGRRRTLMCTALLFGAGAIGTALARDMVMYNLCRILGGVGVGLASVVSPMYIAEIAPARIRGALVTINQLAIVTGSLVSIIVAYYLSFDAQWRWMFASAVLPVLVLVFGLLFAPESPRWLVLKGRVSEALTVLTRIDGKRNAETEVREITTSLAEEGGSWRELLEPGIKKAMNIAVHLAALTQLAGISVATFYAPVIFQKAGFADATKAIQANVIVNIWNFICTAAALVLVDRIGRRPLLLISTPGMVLGLLLLGCAFHFHWGGPVVVLIFLFGVGAYVVGLAPLSWLVMSEIFPNRIRGRAMAIASVSVWISGFIALFAMPLMQRFFEVRFGTPAGAFWVFAAISMYAVIFSWKMVPETKGKTLEEIGRWWIHKN